MLNWKKFDIAIGSSLSIKNKKKEKEKFKILFAYYCEAKEKIFFDELKKIITKLCPLRCDYKKWNRGKMWQTREIFDILHGAAVRQYKLGQK